MALWLLSLRGPEAPGGGDSRRVGATASCHQRSKPWAIQDTRLSKDSHPCRRGRTKCWEGMGNWLPGCYPGEQWGENFLGEDEPSDGHEASSNTPIEYLAPGVIQQVDPMTRPEGKFMRINQGWICTIPLPKGQFLSPWVCRCEDSNGRGTSKRQQGCRSSPCISRPASFLASS